MTQSTAQSVPSTKKPVVLIILDGWGYREAPEDNAVYHANTPFWDQLWATAPHTLISASSLDVGLPEGQFGNSEVGHMSLGAGRVMYQSITRIDKAIKEGDFFTNPAFCQAIDKAKDKNGAVHIFGLLSPGGVHSHENHIFAMIELAAERGAKEVFVHAFLDGRDTPPRSAEESLKTLSEKCAQAGNAKIGSIVGRFYAMDRDKRWDRVQKAYDLLTLGKADYEATDAINALHEAYGRGEDDEFVKPIRLKNIDARVKDNDSIIFMNFRADRAREIAQCFVDENFAGFEREVKPKLSDFVSTTEYAASLKTSIAYFPDSLENSYGELMEKLGKTQLRIAETEKYAHVTFFFSGGREELYKGEDRILVDSPKVETYDLQPEMSAPEVTEKLVAAIKSGKYDTIICNYANGDMVGHTGIFTAAVKAVEALDKCLEKVVAAIREVDGQCLITADHGNCEQMQDYESGQVHTQHTTELVPFIYVGSRQLSLQKTGGKLADVAPTMLALMNVPQPKEMTGQSLISS
jgi:2,3-bisphosphoglycerate-independent phosphoglycerate mutase